jgi:elongation factor 3
MSPGLAAAPLPTVVAKPSTATKDVPSSQEVNEILDKIFFAKESQEALDNAYAVTNLLQTNAGFRGLLDYSVFERIRKAATSKKDGALRESAQILLGALFEVFPRSCPISEVVFLIKEKDLLGLAFDALSDKGGVVRESAQYGIDALFTNLKPESMVAALLPTLCMYLQKKTGKWQGTVGAYALLGKMADKAKMGTGTKDEEKLKEILRETLGRKLSSIIPIVEDGMHDLKGEVSMHHSSTLCPLTPIAGC